MYFLRLEIHAYNSNDLVLAIAIKISVFYLLVIYDNMLIQKQRVLRSKRFAWNWNEDVITIYPFEYRKYL